MRKRLSNGLTVIVAENHAAPVVALQAWVNVGSADEEPAEAGLAHVFEHMLFKGTEARGVGQIAKDIEGAGGDINAWTSFDQTVFHVILASRWFDTGNDILADAVQRSSFDPVELERELKVVLEEIKQGEDSPSRAITQALFSAAYREHPYRRPVIGTEDTVRGFTRDALLGFFKKWYVPSNVTLIVAGDVNAEAALAKVERAWGGWTGGRAPKQAHAEPAQDQARAVVVEKDARETYVSFGFHIPGARHEDTAALDVLAVVLGQGDSSRLNVSVKRERQLASEVYAYSYTPRDPGLLVAGATLPTGDPAPAARAVLGEVFRLAHEDIHAGELAKARTILESDAVYQKETVQGLARKLGFFETVTGALEYEDEYYRQLAALTPARIREVAARYLDARNLTAAALVAPGAKKGVDERLLAIAREEQEAARRRATLAQKLEEGPGGVVKHVLPNGLTILVKRDTSVPVVAVRAVWVGGLRYEDKKTNGVGNLLAALITRGTTTRSGNEISREVEGMAGSLGGFSGRNSFGARLEVMSRDWERGFEILADCLLHPAFPEDELEKERRLALDELAAQDDNLTSVAFHLFGEALYESHPYRFDVTGSKKSVAGLSRKLLVDFYERHFPAGEMTLSVAGDVDPARVIDKVTALFGDGPKAGAEPPRVAREDLWKRRTGEVEVYKFLDRQQAHLVVGFPGVTLDDPDRHALEVLATVLSGQGGRLFLELRDKQGLAYRVSAFSLEGIDPGYFAVYVACSPDNLPAALTGIREELRKVVDEAVPAEELERAKKYLAGAHDISLQRRSALASTLAFNEAYGLGYDAYLSYGTQILAVDAAAVQRVAREIIDWKVAVVATVKPEELTPGAEKRKLGVRKKGKKR